MCSKPPRLNEVLDIVFATPERDIQVNAEVMWSNAYGCDNDDQSGFKLLINIHDL
jgi:hypothetical protein